MSSQTANNFIAMFLEPGDRTAGTGVSRYSDVVVSPTGWGIHGRGGIPLDMPGNRRNEFSVCEEGGRKMKSRERQRAKRKKKEERLESRNCYGLQDPTPRQAIDNIIREERR